MIDYVAKAGLWFGVALTLMCFSQILYKDNPFFRLAEALLVGVGLGNTVVLNIIAIRDKGVLAVTIAGKWWYVIILILGILYFTRASVKYGWISRYPVAITLGVGTGLMMYASAETNILRQIIATSTSVIGGKYTPIDNLIIIVSTLTILMYFIFTIKPTKFTPVVNKVGRYAMLFAFGGYFGNTVMSRLTWLMARMGYLVDAFKSLLGVA